MRKSASDATWFQVCRATVAVLLAVSFIGILVAITAFGIFTGNRDVLLNVLKIVAYGIVFSCAWAGGASLLRRRSGKTPVPKVSGNIGKDVGSGSVLEGEEPYNEG